MNVKLVAVLLVLVMCVPVSAVGFQSAHATDGSVQSNDGLQITDDGTVSPVKQVMPETVPAGTDYSDTPSDHSSAYTDYCDSQYNEGMILVKDSSFSENKLGDLEYVKVEPLFAGSDWQIITLNEGTDTAGSVEYLRSLGVFEQVDYDYIMGADGTIESIGVADNPSYSSQNYIETMCIDQGWLHLYDNNISPGGNSSVIVAVIDTGVDYNHIDLRNNIWINSAEIPGNGIDDDGNGYVDDVRGWDFVGNDADPMDDNGHGTHVAGIVAAENNLIGTVGVAYNCKVMVLKAGNSSGYFNNSAIAQAVQYAYMNGASVINMSFGGSSVSMAVEDALRDAYLQCVLVAAAGNDGLCNNLSHWRDHPVGVSYPAALPFVIGVASVSRNGNSVSSFSNYDDTPNDSVEYEVYACGEQIISAWPNNKIASLSGTSMAAPTVAGIAALLRSFYMDRDVYSNKFIQSQIVNTSTLHPYNGILKDYDLDHGVANTYDALTHVPKPSVKLYDYYFIDSPSLSPGNNGDGLIDAGETVYLAIELRNNGGSAKNVIATIDTIKNGDSSLTDPYVTIVEGSIGLGDIGTYSVRDGGKQYASDGTIDAITNAFVITIGADCPNGYLFTINLRYSYENNWDLSDDTCYSGAYTGDRAMMGTTVSGYKLPEVITEDVTFTSDKMYLVTKDLTIASNATVTFEEGCTIVFTNCDPVKEYPSIFVYGTLIFDGTVDNRITMTTDGLYSLHAGICLQMMTGSIQANYCDITDVITYALEPSIRSQNLKDNVIVSHSEYVLHDYKKNGVTRYCSTNLILGNLVDSKYSGNYHSFRVWDAIRTLIVFDYGGVYAQYSIDGTLCDTIVVVNGSYSASSKINLGYTSSQSPVLNNVMFTSTDESEQAGLDVIPNQNTITTNVVKANAFKGMANAYTSQGTPIFDFIDMDEMPLSDLWPFVKDIEIKDSDGNVVNVLGKDLYTLEITFSTEMDVSNPIRVAYGSSAPFADYKIEGDYQTATKWVGQIDLRKSLENGCQHISISGGLSATDSFKELLEIKGSLQFDIDTTQALSMAISASEDENGVQLDWFQDDYDTLMGYNVYRSTEKDGNYTKLNAQIISAEEHSFTDENAVPGVTYWYTFTVVMSDMSESKPAGKITFTPEDTISPIIYHTPVNQGYAGNNLVVSCVASDNIGVMSATLHYRTVGGSEWSLITMAKQNDRYSATIFGSELSLEGLQYYISVTDGINTITKGSSEQPYNVVIKDASSISQKGDVDGDGTVTTRDALMIMQVLKGDLILTDDQFRRADLNSDDVLSSSEALRILQYINGNVTFLVMA